MQAFAPTAWRRNAGPSLTIPRCVATASAPSTLTSRSGRDTAGIADAGDEPAPRLPWAVWRRRTALIGSDLAPLSSRRGPARLSASALGILPQHLPGNPEAFRFVLTVLGLLPPN